MGLGLGVASQSLFALRHHRQLGYVLLRETGKQVGQGFRVALGAVQSLSQRPATGSVLRMLGNGALQNLDGVLGTALPKQDFSRQQPFIVRQRILQFGHRLAGLRGFLRDPHEAGVGTGPAFLRGLIYVGKQTFQVPGAVQQDTDQCYGQKTRKGEGSRRRNDVGKRINAQSTGQCDQGRQENEDELKPPHDPPYQDLLPPII